MFANTSILPILQYLLSKSSGRWEMAQDSSYTFQPRKPPPPFMIVSRLTPYAADQRVSFLQAIGFSRVLGEAGLPSGVLSEEPSGLWKDLEFGGSWCRVCFLRTVAV